MKYDLECPETCVNGICLEKNGFYSCKCVNGWSGLSCNQSISNKA